MPEEEPGIQNEGGEMNGLDVILDELNAAGSEVRCMSDGQSSLGAVITDWLDQHASEYGSWDDIGEKIAEHVSHRIWPTHLRHDV